MDVPRDKLDDSGLESVSESVIIWGSAGAVEAETVEMFSWVEQRDQVFREVLSDDNRNCFGYIKHLSDSLLRLDIILYNVLFFFAHLESDYSAQDTPPLFASPHAHQNFIIFIL